MTFQQWSECVHAYIALHPGISWPMAELQTLRIFNP